MNIGIIGFGVVGQAIGEGFAQQGHDIYFNDPAWTGSAWKEAQKLSKEEIVNTCEIIFICVGTPPRLDGSCDLSQVYEAFNDLHFHIATANRELIGDADIVQPLIVIKSTVLPGTADSLKEMYPFIVSNPEFLTQKSPVTDFIEPDRIIIGTFQQSSFEKILELYEPWNCPKIRCTPKEAETIKYLSNCLLVTKVAFAQEISRLSSFLKLNAAKVYVGITLDKRINPHHLDPTVGPISQHTPCLTKDMRALINQMDVSGMDTDFLKSAYAKAVDGVYLSTHLKLEEET